ncbi:hypothetical protein HD806DRAFT_491062 [Xylariaceae sp. AK1471]|nr:hypothetical protein HD806DRAFT_491062 [Xylariaceae sp. AK1471]
MPFQFFDNSSIDRNARKLIRSHVAKGKNLGRTTYRPSRHPRQRKVAAHVTPSARTSCSEDPGQGSRPDNSENDGSSLPIQRHLQEDLSTSLPFDTSPMCRRLFHELVTFMNVIPYPPELRQTVINVNGPRLFLQYAFIDEAFFHCTVAMSVAASVSLTVTHKETTEALKHVSRSLRLVNRRLAENRDVALSDTTLAVVIAMTQLERLLGYNHHGLVHFEGCQKIIELRGGISTLVSDCPGIAQKAFRADFDLALQMGSPTRFGAEYVPGETTMHCLRETYRGTRPDSVDTLPFIPCSGEGLRAVLEEVLTLAWLVNDSTVHGIRVNDYDFHSMLLLVGYHLLNVRPLNTPIGVTDTLELLLHLGLTALLTKFFVTLGLKPTDVRLLNRCISTAAKELHCDDKKAQELLLWLLFTGKAAVFRDLDEDMWLIPKISQTAFQLGLSTWDDVSRILQKFPWIPVFEEPTARTIWNQIESSYRPLL